MGVFCRILRKQSRAQTPDKSSTFNSIPAKLNFSVAFVGLLAVASVGISIFAFDQATKQFGSFVGSSVPTLVNAGQLAIESTEISIYSSELLEAKTEESRSEAYERLTMSVEELQGEVQALGTYWSDNPEFAELEASIDKFAEQLTDLGTFTAQNLMVDSQIDEKLQLLFATNAQLTEALQPLVATSYSDLTSAGEDAALKSSQIVDGIIADDFVSFQSLLLLRTEIAAMSGAIASFLMVTDDDLRANYSARMEQSALGFDALKSPLRESGNVSDALAEQINVFGELAGTAQTMLETPFFDRNSAPVQQFIFKVLNLASSIDAELVKAAEGRFSSLTLQAQQAAQQNEQAISDLLSNQVMAARGSMEAISATRELTSLILQGGTGYDLEEIGSINELAAQKFDALKAEVARLNDPGLMASVEMFEPLIDERNGLVWTRSIQLRIADNVDYLVGQVHLDTKLISDAVRSVLEASQTQVFASSTQLENALARSTKALIGIGVAAVLAIIFISLMIVRRGVSKPLVKLIRSTKTLAGGELDQDIDYVDRKDELGQLANALMVFKQNALDKLSAERRTEEMRAKAEEERSLNEAVRAEEAANVEQVVVRLGAGLRHLADGDLTFRIHDEFAGNLDQVRVNFNTSLDNMESAMSKLADTSYQISNSSGELESAADQLSTRTENQAASIEQTALNVGDITGKVGQSSQSAHDMKELAGSAASKAMDITGVVKNAVSAMQKIEENSHDISNIVSLIDEVAFQTNLLALNAGVEAARAGEAGAGFAVVAQEVRELANRTATAAKEIGELIDTSTLQVNEGVSLVNSTGEYISDIVEDIKSINTRIEAIADSSAEQSSMLSDINGAISELDRGTQQNAVMAEETSAATGQLSDLTRQLEAALSVFKTGIGNGHSDQSENLADDQAA